MGDALTGRVQVLGADDKRLQVWIEICKAGVPIATVEQMYLHVDMDANRACPAPQVILDRLAPIAVAHAALPRPPGAGRFVGQPR